MISLPTSVTSRPRSVAKGKAMTLVSITSLRWIRKALLLILLSQIVTGFMLLVIIGKMRWM